METLPVEVTFDDIAEGLTLPKFRKVPFSDAT